MGEHHDGHYVIGMDASNYYYGTWPVSNGNTGGWAFFAYGNYKALDKLSEANNCPCSASFYYGYN